MKKDLKISIITVSYNSEKTISDTINSILKQMYNNIEYIVVDGKSKDKTVEIIKSYESSMKEKGILYKWISEPDKGIYDAMNKGLSLCQGDIIGIINSDDWYEDDAIEIIVETFKKSEDIDIVYGNLNVFDANKVYISTQNPKSLKNIWKYMSITHPTCFVRKKVYESLGGFSLDFKLSSDYDFLLRAYKNNFNFKGINKSIANFRLGGESSTSIKKSLNESYRVRVMNGQNKLKSYYYMKKIELIVLLIKIKNIIWKR